MEYGTFVFDIFLTNKKPGAFATGLFKSIDNLWLRFPSLPTNISKPLTAKAIN